MELARGTTPSGDLVTTDTISGTSLELGDSVYSNGGGITHDVASQRLLGWYYYLSGDDYYRERTMSKLPLPTSKLAGAEIVRAIFHLPLSDVSWTDFSGVHEFGCHLVRVAADVGDATWDQYDDSANLDWGDPGGQAGVDFDSTPLDTVVLDTTLYDLVNAAAITHLNPYFVEANITEALREAAEKAWTTLILMWIAQWASATASSRLLGIQSGSTPDSHNVVPHAWTEIDYLPVLAFFALGSDSSIDYATFLDHEVADRDARVLTGNPPPGGTGPTRPVALGNSTTNDLTEIVITSVRGFAEASSRPSSRRWPRFVDVLDDASGQGYIDGSTRMVPVTASSTRYECYVTPAFGAEVGTPLTTLLGNSYGEYGRDETFIYSGKNAFTIRTEWWGLSPTAIVGDEVWTFKHKKDARPSGYTQEAAEAHEFTQHQGLHEAGTFSRTTADPNKWRDVWNATVQQCCRASRVASFTSGGYGTIDRTHLPVGSSEKFLVGQSATVWDSAHCEHFIIDGLIARTDGTNPDELIAERELTYTYGADAKVSTGIYVGALGARDRSTVAIAALAGQNYLELDAPFRASTGTLRVYSLTSDTVETHAYSTSGSRVNFTDASVLSDDFAVGDLVVVVEVTSWCPVFFRLKPEEGAAEVEQLSLVRAIRSATK